MFEHRPAYVVSGVQLLRDSAPENATHTSARAGDYFVCCVREGPIHGESGGQPPTQFALDFGSIGCGSDQILKHGLPRGPAEPVLVTGNGRLLPRRRGVSGTSRHPWPPAWAG